MDLEVRWEHGQSLSFETIVGSSQGNSQSVASKVLLTVISSTHCSMITSFLNTYYLPLYVFHFKTKQMDVSLAANLFTLYKYKVNMQSSPKCESK